MESIETFFKHLGFNIHEMGAGEVVTAANRLRKRIMKKPILFGMHQMDESLEFLCMSGCYFPAVTEIRIDMFTVQGFSKALDTWNLLITTKHLGVYSVALSFDSSLLAWHVKKFALPTLQDEEVCNVVEYGNVKRLLMEAVEQKNELYTNILRELTNNAGMLSGLLNR